MKIEKLILQFKQGFLIFGIDFDRPLRSIHTSTWVRFLFWTFITLFMGFQSLYWYFTIKNAPEIKFLLGTIAAGLIIFQLRVWIMINKRLCLEEILKWIVERYHARHDEFVEKFARVRFEYLIDVFWKMSRIYGVICVVSTVIVVLLPLCLKSVDYIMPLTISFLPPNGFPYFQLNYLCQSLIATLASLATALYFALYGLILMHIIVELDVILELCEMVGVYEEWLLEMDYVKEMKKTFLGKKSTHEIPCQPENFQKYETLLKNIVDLHTEVSR